MAIYFLTCADDWEGDRILKALLKKRLIVCGKKMPVSSIFLWKGKINEANECQLVMESIAENFDKINAAVSKLTSYETPTLFSIPVSKTTKGVESWLKKELS